MELYYYPECPYCKKVRAFMADNGIELTLLNARERQIADQLIALGGKLQVPALYCDDRILYESDAIIKYLQEH